ncbi:hypothetical protein [Croceicoccus sp. YJ47]|uniref:hypothetical protein n=1 Tax=Croceicoccus sp. YJ47 TaxID=2798724 RepID=UPI001920AC97|nr:hypothetical protein [Croceicoccus sp. YJ47]QQN73143.1 hypothetical protein JD971_09700 [Croceicoccus sp. YJ47]
MNAQPINVSADDARKIAAGDKINLRRINVGRMQTIVPGMLLWVREPFYLPERFDGRAPLQASSADPRLDVRFVAHWTNRPTGYGAARAGRTLPKLFSRLVLRVALVEEQRLQDIDDAGARREGFGNRALFAKDWDRAQRNGFAKSGITAWRNNPSVTVLTFTAEHANIVASAEDATAARSHAAA